MLVFFLESSSSSSSCEAREQTRTQSIVRKEDPFEMLARRSTEMRYLTLVRSFAQPSKTRRGFRRRLCFDASMCPETCCEHVRKHLACFVIDAIRPDLESLLYYPKMQAIGASEPFVAESPLLTQDASYPNPSLCCFLLLPEAPTLKKQETARYTRN